MKKNIPDEWLYPKDLDQAKKVQHQLAERIILQDDFSSVHLIGGMDISNNPYDPLSLVYASVVVLDQKNMQLIDQSNYQEVQNFPYIPGFLGFREAPALVKAFNALKQKPDLILVDGHGISHPRKLGIASHLGVLLNIPTIGVAKSILVGKADEILGENKGDCTPLIWKGEKIGMFLRSKNRCLPLIISAGHRISLETAMQIVKQCLTRYRLPEPTRYAHLTANVYRKEAKKLN